MAVNPIPRGYAGATPYLIIRDAERAIAFYRKVFGAKPVLHLKYPDGKVAHAEIAIGEGHVMISEELPEQGFRGPLTFGGTPVSLLVYVEDVDAVFEKAIAEGAETRHPVADQFYGDRSGTIVDPFGHVWSIATHKQDMSGEAMQKALDEQMAGTGNR